MKDLALPQYDALHQVLNKTSLKLHPSEVHGLLCGILAGNNKAESAWEELVTGGKDTPKAHQVLHELYQVSKKQLDEFLFEFELVLPEDSEELPARAEALTMWCQGFLTGLKLVKIPIVDRAPGEVTEAINDIIEIAKMNYEDVVTSEEDEAAYVELVEYIRMAVILIYEELREIDTSGPSTSSNHLH
jgi:uncharacterized protein YgfB (UPF0149 family)